MTLLTHIDKGSSIKLIFLSFIIGLAIAFAILLTLENHPLIGRFLLAGILGYWCPELVYRALNKYRGRA